MAHGHAHSHDDHDHGSAHDHAHDHGHDHAQVDRRRLAPRDDVVAGLVEFDLVPEEWGGTTIFANVSAKQRLGLLPSAQQPPLQPQPSAWTKWLS